jgi:hypothetical protein
MRAAHERDDQPEVNQTVQFLQPRVLTSQFFRLFSASIRRHSQGIIIRLSNWPSSLSIDLAKFTPDRLAATTPSRAG